MRLQVHNGELCIRDGDNLTPVEGIEINGMRVLKHPDLGDTVTMQITLRPDEKQVHIKQSEDEKFFKHVQVRSPTGHDTHLAQLPVTTFKQTVNDMIPAGTGYKLPSGKVVYYSDGQWGDNKDPSNWTEEKVLQADINTGLPLNSEGEQIDGEFLS